MTNKVYVGNLNYEVSETDLREFFSDCGEISSVTVPTDRATGRTRGFGFVEFKNSDFANNATKKDGQELMGRKLKVNIAKEREERSGGGGRGGRSGGGGRSFGGDRSSDRGGW